MQISAFICSMVLIGSSLLYKILKTVVFCHVIRFISMYFNCYSTSVLCMIILIFLYQPKRFFVSGLRHTKDFRRYLFAIKLNWRTTSKHNERFEKHLFFFQYRQQKNGLCAQRASSTLREICCYNTAIHIDLLYNSTQHRKW